MKKQINIAIIGMGYVGLPLAVEFGKKYNTIGFDIDKKKISSLCKYKDPNREISIKEIMAYFAKIGLNYKVLEVLAVDDKDTADENGQEVEQLGIDYLKNLDGYPYWVQTSFNNNIRKNYAGIGFRYDEDLDAFIPPKTFSSWSLNEETCQWEAPTPYPGDADTEYMWDEEVQDWQLLEEQPTE